MLLHRSVTQVTEEVETITGTHIHPQSCLHDAAEAFLHSRSTACLMGSFWLGHSRGMLLCQDGNVLVNSGKRKKQNRVG